MTDATRRAGWHTAGDARPAALLPDFALIALGHLICRHTALDRPVWDGAERLVYYLLFPALLFNTIVKNPIRPADLLQLGGAGLAVTALGIGLAYALARAPGTDRLLHASGAQCAFRFNSYVALALAERLAGSQGLAWQALLTSLCVPLCNVAAVWPLARAGGHGYLRELSRNPLILSTGAGLVCNLAGLHLPELAGITLGRIGAAALPLGLMAVGAGLRFGALRESRPPRYDIAELAEKSTFLEVAYLLIYGELPRKPEFDAFRESITRHTMIHEDLKRLYDGFPKDSHPMATLGSMINTLSGFYTKEASDPLDPVGRELSIHRLLAKSPTIAAFSHKKSIGHPFMYPKNSLSYVANFMQMMFSVPAGRARTLPTTFRQNSLRTPSAVLNISARSGSQTICTRPSRSRRSMKMTPPWSRRRWAQPISVTVWSSSFSLTRPQ